MGAIPYDGGTTFRVWAPHAEAVFVTGTFDDWADGRDAARARRRRARGGTWSADVPGVAPGAEYRFTIRTPDGDLSRMDPYARQVTSSVGQRRRLRPGRVRLGRRRLPRRRAGTTSSSTRCTSGRSRRRRTGAAPSTPPAAACRTCASWACPPIQVMPPFEFAGDISWGYNPAHLFAIESGYGGPDAFKRFIRDAHAHGIAVIVDVVHNHLGPSDLDLWRFDGWAEGDGGGIYFYNDDRAETPWGATRPDYGRGEVRTFLRDSALTWLEEFRCDGLRFDATVYIRSVTGKPGDAGQTLARRLVVHGLAQRRDPRPPAVEDHDRRGHPGRPVDRRADGRRRRRLQRPVGRRCSSTTSGPRSRRTTTPTGTWRRSRRRSWARAAARRGRASSTRSRTTTWPTARRACRRRSRPATPTAGGPRSGRSSARRWSSPRPGIPMLFQGQELLEDRWFDDTVALDWDEGQLQQRDPAPAPRPDRAAPGEGWRDARPRAARTRESSAPTTTPRSS